MARWPVAWRGIGWFWLGMLLVTITGSVTLQVLGPISRPILAAGPVSLLSVAEPGWNGKIAEPDAALLEASRLFPKAAVPRIGVDGRLPRIVYRRPAPASGSRPRIALLLAGIGLSSVDSRTAIDLLPGVVTLAFSAYTPNPESLMAAARLHGHEVLASLPMESNGYPWIDAGPRALLTGKAPAANHESLEWAMSRLQGYVGLTGASDGLRGERFAEQSSSLDQVLDEVARRGLLYIDPRPGAPAPHGVGRAIDVVIDDPSTRADIEAKLAMLERMAREHGSAVGLAGPLHPTTVERISAWARDVESRGYELVPVSALTAGPVP